MSGHHNAEADIDAYIGAAGIADEREDPLLRSVYRHRRLTLSRMIRINVWWMIKRRAEDAGLLSFTCCHIFRATSITACLENGGIIENAQAVAAQESPRTIKLYDRTSDTITLDEVRRIAIRMAASHR